MQHGPEYIVAHFAAQQSDGRLWNNLLSCTNLFWLLK
jgi:hypothetical protein